MSSSVKGPGATPAQRVEYSRVAKIGMLWGGVRVWANELIFIPSTIILARLLSPAEFGVAAAAAFFLQLASRLSQMGLNAGLMRLKHLTKEHTSSVFVASLTVSGLMYVACALSAPAIGRYLHSPDAGRVIPVAGLGFIIAAFGVVPITLIGRELRFRAAAVPDLTATIVNTTLCITLALAGYSFWSLVFGQLAGELARSVTAIAISRWRPSLRFSKAAFADLMSFGLGVYGKNLLEYLAQNIDNLIVGRTLGIAALGFYDKAFTTMARVVSRLSLSGPAVSFRIFSLIHEDQDRFRRAYRKVILGVSFTGLPVLAGIAASAPELFAIGYGERWLTAVPAFQLLCVVGMMKMLNAYATSATQAKGFIWAETGRQGIYALLIVAGVVAGSRWGITGAAAGVLAATLTMTMLLQHMLQRLTKLAWSDLLLPLVPGVVCAAALALVVHGAGTALHAALGAPPPWLILPVKVVVGAVFYIAFLWAPGFAEPRALFEETLLEFAPGVVKRLKGWAPMNWSLARGR